MDFPKGIYTVTDEGLETVQDRLNKIQMDLWRKHGIPSEVKITKKAEGIFELEVTFQAEMATVTLNPTVLAIGSAITEFEELLNS